MGSLYVRLLFVLYALLVGFAALGHFDPEATRHLTTLGLRSAVGVLLYLLAGLVTAYVYLWQKRKRHLRELRRAAGLPPVADGAGGAGGAGQGGAARQELDLKVLELQTERDHASQRHTAQGMRRRD